MNPIYLSGEVVNWQDKESLSYGCISLAAVRDQVEQRIADGDESLLLMIHSPGGDVNEGFAIYDYLKGLDIEVNTAINGTCASIATVFLMAGKARAMSEHSEIMIHTPFMIGVTGDADYLAKKSEQAKAAEERLLNFYVETTGASEDVLSAYMKEEKYFTAEEAKDFGFITKIEETVSAIARLDSNNSNYHKMKTEKNAGEIKSLKDQFAKLLNLVKGSSDPKNLVVELAGGEMLTVDTEAEEIAVGDAVTVEDGSYELADGRTVVVTEGAIAEINDADDAEALKKANEELTANLEASAASLKEANDRIEALEASSKEVADNAVALGEQIEALEATLSGKKSKKPVNKKQTSFTKKPADQGTSADDFRAKRESYKAKATLASTGRK